MKYNNEKQNNPDHALINAVTSAFRSISPSYSKAHAWYEKRNDLKPKISPVPVKIRSRYYIPLFGSVFASALALVMILTSNNNVIPSGNVAFNTENTQGLSENADVASFSTMRTKTTDTGSNGRHVLSRIDAQSKSVSRTQADESFTESLNTETSLKDLFE